MTPDDPKTPRQEMEAWLTSLLLGELSEGEAAAVRALMAHDPELAKLHGRLKEAIALVRETVPHMEAPSAPAEPLKLSEERRQKLLTSFKIPPLKLEDRKPKPRFQFQLVPVLVVLTAVAVLTAMLLPTLTSARRSAQWDYLSLSLLGSKTTEEAISATPATAPPSDSAVAESTRRPAVNFNWYAEQSQQRLSESRSEGDRRLLDNRVQISGQPAFPAMRQSDASGRGVDPTTGVPVDSLAAVPSKHMQIVLPAVAESAGATEGNKVTLGNEFSWGVSERNGRGFYDNKTQLGQSATLFARDPQWTGSLEQPASSPANAFQGRSAYVSPGSGPSLDFSRAKPELAAQPRTEANVTVSGERLKEALKNSSDAKTGADQLAAGGAFIQPTRLDADTLRRGGAVVANTTSATPEQTAFMRRYGLSPGKPVAGFGGGVGGGAVASSGGVTLGIQPTLSQTAPGYVVVGDAVTPVAVLADLPSEGKLFRSEQPSSETPRLGFSLLGPKSQANQAAWADFDNDGLQDLFYRADGVAVAGKEIRKTTDAAGFAGRPLAREGGVPGQLATPPPVVAAGESVGRQSAPIVLPLVDQETVSTPAIDVARREVIARNGAVPQRSLRESSSGVKENPAGTTVSTRGDEQLLAESRLSDAILARPKNREQLPQDRGRAAERAPTPEAEVVVVLQKDEGDAAKARTSTNAPIPQPEIQTSENSFSTFSLNVSDVSFKLAAASLEKGQMPDTASVRSEEFINAFDYRDPEPLPGAPIAFAWERARYPFAHNRDLLRFSLKTAAAGRPAGRPLNIVLLLDNSGSMERADRVRIIREALRVLAAQLQPQDKLSVITFARTARLVADGIAGDHAGEVIEQVSGLTPQGGTNLEEAMNLAYQTALRHYLSGGINRVVLLTDGAANLGNVEPDSLKQKVETHRKQGVALDCFGIGWEGFNDDLLEVLSRNGDGRYGFINSPEEAATDFAGQLAGALKVAASDVKVQVEFNPRRVTAYRQVGYAKHQLTKEQFRDNTVDAAEIAAQEAGNALYTVEVNPAGDGPLCTVRVRFRFAGTWEYREQAWDVPYSGNAPSLEQCSAAMRLAASASAFAEWLVASPFAGEVTPDRLLGYVSGVPEVYGADARPKKLEWMIRQAKSLEGK